MSDDFDDDDDVQEGLPEDLPEIGGRTHVASALDRSRNCPKCGTEGRIVSNYLGVNIHCNACKTFWPVSRPLNPIQIDPASMPRGLSKQTLTEPDMNDLSSIDQTSEVAAHDKVRYGKK